MPFYRNTVNVVWCSIWFGLLYTAIWFVVSIFQKDQSYDAKRRVTLVSPMLLVTWLAGPFFLQ